MLEQILDLVKQQGQQSVVENTDIPNEQNNEVMKEAASTITDGFQNVLSSGGLQSIIGMFSDDKNTSKGGLLSHPLVGTMIGQLANKLIKKMNLSPAVANSVANNIIPGVLSKLIGNTRSTDASHATFNLNDLIGSFTGNSGSQSSGFDFQSLLGQFTGNDREPQVNLEEANADVSQKAQQQKGGLSDLIQNFFK